MNVKKKRIVFFRRIWDFTLRPSMHRHDFDYSFVAVKPSRRREATEASLRVNGDFL